MAIKPSESAGRPAKRKQLVQLPNNQLIDEYQHSDSDDSDYLNDNVDDIDSDEVESSELDDSDAELQWGDQLHLDSEQDEQQDDVAEHSDDSDINNFVTESDQPSSTANPHDSTSSDSDIDDTIDDLTQYNVNIPTPYSTDKPRKLFYSDNNEYGNDVIYDARVADREHNLANLSDSDTEGNIDGTELQYTNRIGNIPIEWYDTMRHIGYNITGKPIQRKHGGDSIDQWLNGVGGDNPNYSRTVYDAVNDQHIVLNDHELSIIQQLRKHRFPDKNYNEHEDMVEFYTSKIRHEQIGDGMEPKRRFIPSKHEARTVRRLVHALRNGWIKTAEQRESDRQAKLSKLNDVYPIWNNNDTVIDPTNKLHRQPTHIIAPKPTLPTHAESYNPPAEYIPTPTELQQWSLLSDRDKPYNFIPQNYSTMRHIPVYSNIINERFERCLDLYLAPRVRRKKLHINPNQLIPRLPKPNELRPFPTDLSITYTHSSKHMKIRCITVSADGQWMCSGCDDGTVKLWELSTGRVFKQWSFINRYEPNECVIESIQFNPVSTMPLISVCVSHYIFILCTHTSSDTNNLKAQQLLFQPQQQFNIISDTAVELSRKQQNVLKHVSWRVTRETPNQSHIYIESPPTKKSYHNAGEGEGEGEPVDVNKVLENDAGEDEITNLTGVERTVLLRITIGKRVKQCVWHYKGDYFASIHNIDSSTSNILIHKLSKHTTQIPFKKSFGSLLSCILFHSSKPIFYICSKTQVKVYNLQTQSLIKTYTTQSKYISSISLHPAGDNFICGTYDKRVMWYDMDSSATPYKTLKYHKKAVRSVAYHTIYPLFATSSDDGTIHIFHNTVYDDLITNPLIVPLKIIHAHMPSQQTNELGVLQIQWHTTQPWLLSAGADGLIKLWTC